MTASDVAAAAGVSRATVSYVFNPRSPVAVSGPTRARVLRAAGELGYTPNPLARGLRGKSTGVIGVVVGHIDVNYVGLSIVRAICAKAFASGYQVLITDATGVPTLEATQVRVLLDRAVDGLIFNGPQSAESVLLARDSGLPVLMVERYPEVAGVPGVCVDERSGSVLAIRHLADLGHRDLAYVGLEDLHEADRERFQGAAQAASDRGCTMRPEWICRLSGQNANASYDFTRHLLTMDPRPTAVYAGGNLFAIEVLRAARDAGVALPDELSVISFDDEYAEFTHPRLTTVSAPAEGLAEAAVNIMMDLLRQGGGRGPVPSNTEIAPLLSVRESCARI